MDELELGKVLGRIESKLDDALLKHTSCRAEITSRLMVLEQRQQPTTVRDVWGWAWRVGAGAAAVSGGALAVRALVLAMHP
jgi:hypothetical protein